MQQEVPRLRLDEAMKVPLDWFPKPVDVGEAHIEQKTFAGIDYRGAMQGRAVEPGTYTVLWVDGQLMMSDTPSELRDHLPFVQKATGKVLVGGLGLGCVVRGLLAKPDVTEVTVLEFSKDVIAAIGPRMQDKRLRIVQADVYEWLPIDEPERTQRFDFCWMDVWPTICGDDYPKHLIVKKRFGQFCETPVECWAEKRVRKEGAADVGEEVEFCHYSTCTEEAQYTCTDCGQPICADDGANSLQNGRRDKDGNELLDECNDCCEVVCEGCEDDHECWKGGEAEEPEDGDD